MATSLDPPAETHEVRPPQSGGLAEAGRPPHVVCGQAIAVEVERRVVTSVLQEVSEASEPALAERLYETLYCEEQRLARQARQAPRRKDDRRFYAELRRQLRGADKERVEALLWTVVEHYVEEISGRFDPRIYVIATHALPLGFTALLRAFGLAKGHGDVSTSHEPLPPASGLPSAHLDARIRIEGNVAAFRRLAASETVILAPSHVSNLDSVVLGWAIHRLGLPPFAYGAGLNLFSNAGLGFFLKNLGAYTVDRSKTDPLYRRTLKEYSTVLLEHGQHCLFFPGGTRSRSGAVESRLKLGLLGTARIADRQRRAVGQSRRVHVVPCTLTYPLVIEAASLVDDFLRTEGRARYIDRRDEFDRPARWLDLVRSYVEQDLAIHVRFGDPIDVASDEPAEDTAATRLVAQRLLEAYRRDTLALPTSVLAFAVFQRLRQTRGPSDLFRFLASLDPAIGIPIEDVVADVGRLGEELARLASEGRITLSADLRGPPEVVVRRALSAFQTYHPRRVVRVDDGRLHASDPNLLYYYQNRLDHLGLLGTPSSLPSASASAIAAAS